MNIRQAEPQDIPEIKEMYVRLYEILGGAGLCYKLNEDSISELLSTQIRSRLCHILVAADEGGAFGFISVSVSRVDRRMKAESDFIGYINDLYVSPDRRRCGAASALLAGAEAWAKSMGAGEITCDIAIKNETALAFWQSKGYAGITVAAHKSL